MPIAESSANVVKPLETDTVTETHTPHEPPALTWRCPQPDLWVAVDGEGRPAGIVAQHRRALFVTTAVTGRSLGQHESLSLAQAALERHVAAVPVRVGALSA